MMKVKVRVFVCVVLALLGGCKSSQNVSNTERPPAQAQPQSPSISSEAGQPNTDQALPDSTPTPIEEMVPVKTYQLHPPAAFSGDQVPNNQASEFQIEAKAGQFLRVESPQVYMVSAQPMLKGAEPLHAGTSGCGNDQIYFFPKTGKYRLLFAPRDGGREIKFSWMDSHDPILDAGIKPSQVSIDLGAFAGKDQLTLQPIVGCDEEDSSARPTHIGVDNKNFEFRIISMDAYLKVRPEDRAPANLKAFLEKEKNDSTPNPEDFPYPLRNEWDCRYVTTLKPARILGEGWHGVRWIGGLGGDEEYPSCELAYAFNGISNDGRYLIILLANIEHADQKRFMPKRKVVGPAGHTWEESDPKLETEMRQLLEKSLNAADPSSFTPNLNDLDAVIRSLKLKQ